MNEVTGGWRLFTKSNPRRVRWTGHVAYMGEMRMHTKFWLENLEKSDN
jgi:hypothetical protein